MITFTQIKWYAINYRTQLIAVRTPFVLDDVFIMNNIKIKLERLVIFIDILKIIEIIMVVAFSFYELYLKFNILLTIYKILYIVLAILAIAIIILVNDSFNCLMKGFFIILENNYQEIEERKHKPKEQKTKAVSKTSKTKKTKQEN